MPLRRGTTRATNGECWPAARTPAGQPQDARWAPVRASTVGLDARLGASPLLVVYVGVTLASWPSHWVGDEGRYLQFAENFRRGHYALAGDDYLWNGPGYPLMLAAWNATGLPPRWARFGNAGFLFLAVVLFARFMSLYVPRRWAIGIAWAMGLHVPLYVGLAQLSTESLAVCLVCGACLAAAVVLRTGRRTATVSAGLLLGWLALTKVLFGYVLLGGLILYGLAAAVAWQRRPLRRMAAIYLVGLLATTPYLAYTFHLTGKVFYWSNCGGLSLYWMSTPYNEEWGDWFHPSDVRHRPELSRHRQLFDSIAHLSPLEKDAALRRQALDNITVHPAKFVKNVAANVTRISVFVSLQLYAAEAQHVVLRPAQFISSVGPGLRRSGARDAASAGRPRLSPGAHVRLPDIRGKRVARAYARMLDPIVPEAFFLVGLAAHAAWGDKRQRNSQWRGRGRDVCSPHLCASETRSPRERRAVLFGVKITDVRMARALEIVHGMIRKRDGRTRSVYFVNACALNLAAANPVYRKVLNSADCVFGDGTGVRWAVRLRGIRLRDNVNGTDLVPAPLSDASYDRTAVLLVGADEESIGRAARYAAAAFPNWTVAGCHHGYLTTPELDDSAVAQINQARADVLLVGMGNPLQEQWIAAHRGWLRVPVCLGVGGLFDYWAGTIRRAPRWLRGRGFEWVGILAQQPQKARRYLIGNPLFLARAFRDAWDDRHERVAVPMPGDAGNHPVHP